MKGLLRHPLRVTGRFFWFVGFLLTAALDFLVHCAFRKNSTRESRSLWTQRNARRVLKFSDCNRKLSDDSIARIARFKSFELCGYSGDRVHHAAVFVAKREIKYWPVIGWLTQMAGTLFVNRERRTQVGKMNCEIQTRSMTARSWFYFPKEPVQTAKCFAIQIRAAATGGQTNAATFHRLCSLCAR